MPAFAPPTQRDQLEQFDQYLERFIETVREEAEQVDVEQLERLLDTAKRLGLRLEEKLPPTLDPAVASEIRQILIGGMRKFGQLQDQPLDLLDDFLLRAESIRHIVRDALDEDMSAELDVTNKRAVAEWLTQELEGVPQTDIAELLGVDVRTFQRWLRGIGGATPQQARTLVKLVAILRTTWGSRGVVAWFKRRRPDLGNAVPLDLLPNPALEHELAGAARRGRTQHGS